MTREEAIRILQLMGLNIRYPNGFAEKLSEKDNAKSIAITLAIEALQEPPRVHGRWKYRAIHEFNSNGELIKYCDIPYCSECGREYGTIRDIPYCNCGAIMDEGK